MEKMDDVVSGRRAGVKAGVVAGSVWERRMRSDDVRGGIKVFNGEEKTEEESGESNGGGGNAGRVKWAGPVGGKRKARKTEGGGDGPRVLTTLDARGKAELSKNGDEVVVKEASVSAANGAVKKNPSALAKRGRRDAVSGGADRAIQRSPPVQVRRSRSEAVKGGSVEKSSVELRKVKSYSAEILDRPRRDGDDNESEENAVRLSTAKSEPPTVLYESCQLEPEEEEVEKKEAIDGSADGYDEDPVGESRSDEIRKEVISSNVSQVKSAPKEAPGNDEDNSNDNAPNDLVEEEEEEEFSEELEEGGECDEDTETELESKSLEIKEIVVTEEKVTTEAEPVNKKSLEEIKAIAVTEEKISDVVVKEEIIKPIQVAEKPKSISPTAVKKQPPPPAVKQTRVHRNIANPTPTKTFISSSSNVHKQPPPLTRRSSLHQNFTTKANSFSDKYQSVPERQNKLQNLGQFYSLARVMDL